MRRWLIAHGAGDTNTTAPAPPPDSHHATPPLHHRTENPLTATPKTEITQPDEAHSLVVK